MAFRTVSTVVHDLFIGFLLGLTFGLLYTVGPLALIPLAVAAWLTVIWSDDKIYNKSREGRGKTLMSRRSELPQSRRHVLIFDEDWEFLEANYGQYSANRIGVGVAVRRIVHQQVRFLRQKAQDLADARQGAGAERGEATDAEAAE